MKKISIAPSVGARTVAFLSFAVLVAACSGGGVTVTERNGSEGAGSSKDATEPSGGEGGSEGSSSSDAPKTPPSSTKPKGATDVTCKVAEDCGHWVCECETGAPVNARTCDNGYCLDSSAVCPKSCEAFGTSWTGRATGSAKPAACGGYSSSSPSCDSCFKSRCCSSGDACARNSQCAQLKTCTEPCTTQRCLDDCRSLYPSGTSDFDALDRCLAGSCATECGG